MSERAPAIGWKAFAMFFMVACVCPDWTAAGPLHDAAKTGDLAALKAQIDAGVDINEKAASFTALAEAVRAQQKSAVEFLTSRGADPNTESLLGTPLQIAATKGATEIASILLDAGADPDAGAKRTPLFIAVNKGHRDIVSLLLTSGVDPDATAGAGMETALHEAARLGNRQLVEMLIQGGADPNALTIRMQHAYHLALINGREEVAEYLKPITAPDFRPEPVTELIAKVDIEKAEDIARAECGICHQLGNLTSDFSNHFGPRLWSVEGLPKGSSDPEFSYSRGMYESETGWSEEELNRFIAAAAIVVPGTLMDHEPGYAPVTAPETRANVIALLRTLGPPPDQ